VKNKEAAMKDTIINFLNGTEPGKGTAHENLTVYPLFTELKSPLSYKTLEEGIKEGKVRIGEVSQAGHVPELYFENQGDERIFLMDGEELIGAKQNRVLNTSILTEVRSKTVIPVSCVEQGRWRSDSAHMDTGCFLSPEVRSAKTASVSANLKHNKMYCSDQGAVWAGVDNVLRESGAENCSSQLHHAYKMQAGRLEGYLKNIPCPEGAVGVVAVIGGRPVCADIFDQARTLEKLWARILKSYALDALRDGKKGAKPVEAAPGSFIRPEKFTEFSAFDSIGLGQDVRFAGPGFTASALVVESTVVHCSFLRHVKRAPRSYRTGGFCIE
jgi:hypothetical protein